MFIKISSWILNEIQYFQLIFSHSDQAKENKKKQFSYLTSDIPIGPISPTEFPKSLP